MKPVQITANTVAEFHYTLTNANNEVIDSSRDREPMRYLHGANTIVSGLEQEMEGKQRGDTFQVKVTPENGYGERVDQLVQNVPRSAFEGIDEVAPGMRFRAETQNGPVTVTVTEVGDEEVTVDGNTLTNVGVRKKGFQGSLSTTEPSFKVKFDEKVFGSRYF